MSDEIISSAASGAAAGSVAGPIGSVVGGLIGAAGSFFSGKQSADFAERSYKHRYRWMVNDLKKAGLNPMLALSNGPGSVPQPNFENIGEGALQGAEKGAEVANAKTRQTAEMNLMTAQASSARQQARKTQLEGDAQQITNNQLVEALGITRDKGYTDIQKGEVEIDNLVKTGALIAEQIRAKGIENMTEQQMSPLRIAYQRYINEKTRLGLSEAKASAQFFDDMSAGAKYAPYVMDAIKLYLLSRSGK